MREFIPQALAVFLVASLSWRRILRRKALPGVPRLLKVAHSVAFAFVALVCWDWLLLADSIIEHPHLWVDHLSQEKRFYPVWVDTVFQAAESGLGLAGLTCCLFILARREGARSTLLFLLPPVCLCFWYKGVRAFRDYLPRLPSLVLIVGALAVIPFLAAFIFYSHPSVAKALFRDTAAKPK